MFGRKYRSTNPDPESLSDVPNVSGASPRDIIAGEDAAQRAVAESSTWLLAREVNSPKRGDSKDGLKKLGFKVKGTRDGLFYEVVPPRGWTKSTEGYWTTVQDEQGRERISQFFKGAFYDRRAFLNFVS